MARPLRIEFEGAVYHVPSRGDRREPIFEDDEDRLALLRVMAAGLDRLDASLLACQLPNADCRHAPRFMSRWAGSASRFWKTRALFRLSVDESGLTRARRVAGLDARQLHSYIWS